MRALAGNTGLINAKVIFTPGANGGVIGGNAQVVTDATGAATVGSWSLPNVAGVYTLTATSVDIPGSTVTFTATVSAGAPAQMIRNSADPQTAVVATAVAAPPSVKVLDALGNPVPLATVTFAVTAGGGSITGPSMATNAQGVATVGSWTLGPNPGTNTLLASKALVPSVAFTATATAAAPSGGIVFVTDRDGNKEIYTVKPDGTGLANLTNNAGAR